MKKTWYIRLVLLIAFSLTAFTFVAVAADVGSSGDPLVTLSYLNDTYTASVLNKVDSKITERNKALEAKLNGGATANSANFVLVTMSKGQTLNGDIGTEIMLRVGTASCVASSSPGLIDTTDASTINNGAALVKNHIYMSTIENRGMKATAATVKVLVRGAYTIS